MCFSAKLLMDRVLLLVLMPTALGISTSTSSQISKIVSTPTYSTPPETTSEPQTIHKPNIVVLPPVVGRIKVNWIKTNPCQGYILFFINFTQRATYLCSNNDKITNTDLGNELCEERRCGEFLGFRNSYTIGYMIHENLTATSDIHCKRILLTCKDVDSKELVAYKVITGLLLTLIIAVLLCRFAQPTYIAVRKRFSQKRQNRWIGPTQTQSVSYHRGQANYPNNNTMKRQSYPGLERLTVNPSREPSSNRNSDYDSYGG
ncbi:T-cell surface glycoprotein CD5 [Ictalurus furcatus]|uniref:T-cell surface glycoprotein CD5 n=1 Tax=Ictalurus furcatus TaxID=66913 RepID=UPI002350B905|nr:T-cell surface glycoprotein CD5 [Ictalurus furcatus]